jgi:hypothetical protein
LPIADFQLPIGRNGKSQMPNRKWQMANGKWQLLRALLLTLLCPAVAWAAQTPIGSQYWVRFDRTGTWRLETSKGPLLVNCGLRIWTKTGYLKQSEARAAGPPSRGPAGHTFHGTFRIGAKTARYWQTATPVPNGLLVRYAVAAEALAETDAQSEGNHIAAAFDLPVETFRGALCTVAAPKGAPSPEPLTLPAAKAAKPRLVELESTTALTVRRNGLVLSFQRSPSGKIIVQDAREWHRPYFQALLYARRSVGDPAGWRSVSFLLTIGKPPSGPVLAAVVPGKSALPCHDIHEAEVHFWAPYDNPYVPAEIRLWADVLAPSGRRFEAPAFVTRDHRRSREGGAEVLTPLGHTRWRLRIAPTEPGTHRYTVHVATPGGAASSEPITFAASRSRSRGFLQAPSKQTRYLEDADGRPCFLIGHNYCWPDAKAGTYALDEALDTMGRSGVNATRLWLCSWGIHLEGTRPDDYRLDHAWRLDHILRRARQRGVRVQLCLDNFTDLSATERAAKNPYLARNGGPCRRPADFFTSPKARQQYERRLRYLIARFAPFSSLLAWELGSELDYATASRRDPALLSWARDAAAYLKQHDPYRHVVTISLGLGSSWDKLWQLPHIDIIQPHAYIHRPVYVPDASELDAAALVLRHKERLAAIAKPMLIGEFGFLGSKDFNPLNEADKTGVHLHNAIWAAALSGCAGTPLNWWWDTYLHKNSLHYHYAALGRFLRGEPLPGPDWSFIRDAGKGHIRVVGFRTDTRALLWIQHRDNRWYRRLIEQSEPATLAPASIDLRRLTDGHYRIEWWDTYAGQPITHALVATRNGVLTIRVPRGQPDIACKIRRVAD